MKKLTTLLALILCFSIVLLNISVVDATERQENYDNFDWESIDWRTIDWKTLPNSGDFENAWYEWMTTNADLEDLFAMSVNCRDSVTESVAVELVRRFQADPAAFLQALAPEEEEIRDSVLQDIVWGADDWDRFVTVLNALRMEDLETKAEKSLLKELVSIAQEWAEDINKPSPNPKTADNAQLFAALVGMLVCSTGLIVARRRIV